MLFNYTKKSSTELRLRLKMCQGKRALLAVDSFSPPILEFLNQKSPHLNEKQLTLEKTAIERKKISLNNARKKSFTNPYQQTQLKSNER